MRRAPDYEHWATASLALLGASCSAISYAIRIEHVVGVSVYLSVVSYPNFYQVFLIEAKISGLDHFS